MEKNKNKSSQEKLTGFYLLLLVVIVIWGLSLILIPLSYPLIGDRGSFGDSFGVINSLFSGLAFAGIIYTILLQRKELIMQREELVLQRKELVDTRKELERSANAQEKSETQQKRQSENLKITAKLHAMSTLVSYYSLIETKTFNKSVEKYEFAIKEQEQYIERIKEILRKKDL